MPSVVLLLTGLLTAAVSIGLDVPETDLGGAIALRLVEDGYDICPIGLPAVRVRPTTDGYRLTFPDRPGDVLRIRHSVRSVAELELVHRIALWVRKNSSEPHPKCRLLRMAFEEGVSPSSRSRGAARVLADGWGLTRAPRRARAGRCVRKTSSGTHIEPGPSQTPCDRRGSSRAVSRRGKKTPGPISPAKSPPRPTKRTASPMAAKTPATSSVATVRTPITPPPTQTSAPTDGDDRPPDDGAWEILANLAGAITARPNGVDPTVVLELQAYRQNAGFHVAAVFLSAAEESAQVQEGFVGVGPSVRFGLGKLWTAQVALLGGAHAHFFQVGKQSGTRADVALELPIKFVWNDHRPAALAIDIRPGVAGRARRHTVGDEVLWERGAVRLTVGLSLGMALAP